MGYHEKYIKYKQKYITLKKYKINISNILNKINHNINFFNKSIIKLDNILDNDSNTSNYNSKYIKYKNFINDVKYITIHFRDVIELYYNAYIDATKYYYITLEKIKKKKNELLKKEMNSVNFIKKNILEIIIYLLEYILYKQKNILNIQSTVNNYKSINTLEGGDMNFTEFTEAITNKIKNSEKTIETIAENNAIIKQNIESLRDKIESIKNDEYYLKIKEQLESFISKYEEMDIDEDDELTTEQILEQVTEFINKTVEDLKKAYMAEKLNSTDIEFEKYLEELKFYIINEIFDDQKGGAGPKKIKIQSKKQLMYNKCDQTFRYTFISTKNIHNKYIYIYIYI